MKPSVSIHSKADPAWRARHRAAAPSAKAHLIEGVRERLGVTDPNASADDLLAAFDAKTAPKAQAPAARRTEDALYDKAWGAEDRQAPVATAPAPRRKSDDDLYAAAWGDDRKGA